MYIIYKRYLLILTRWHS